MRFSKALWVIASAWLGIFLSSAHAQRSATATPTVANGFVIAVTITDGGTGYTNAPQVTISGGGGSGAVAIATVLNGSVDKVIVQNAGSGYTGIPAVVIDSPPAPKPPFSDGLVAYFPFETTADREYPLQKTSLTQNLMFAIDNDTGYKFMSFREYGSFIQSDELYINGREQYSISFYLRSFSTQLLGEVIYTEGPSGAAINVFLNTDGNICINTWIAPDSWTTLSSRKSISDGKWHHVCITALLNMNGAIDSRIYVDSVEVGNGNVTKVVAFSNGSILFGKVLRGAGFPYDLQFFGDLSHFRIYNRALSAQDVTDLYYYEAPAQPWVTLKVKTVQVTMHVKPARKYQLEASLDLKTWANAGQPFVANAFEVDQEFNAIEVGRYFRLSEVP